MAQDCHHSNKALGSAGLGRKIKYPKYVIWKQLLTTSSPTFLKIQDVGSAPLLREQGEAGSLTKDSRAQTCSQISPGPEPWSWGQAHPDPSKS